jgi:hypothetical protein
MASLEEIMEEIREHIEVMREPTITKSVFNEVTSVDDAMVEDLPLNVKAQEAQSVRISYGGGELYDIYVIKI